ncbi:MAG: hypothetical protein KME08_05545 [Aphanothece sp. CMT-3BRIN-NPC111]|jgi:signal-transduction protein with cAMP-binding, CBS, and nucleotidyltransferase domain|nr:hypothetical protein [Aphanothece sp. CMT-3BRIN-NPC111]
MQATIDQLSQILIFRDLTRSELEPLQPHTQVQHYRQGEILMHESDRLPDNSYRI